MDKKIIRRLIHKLPTAGKSLCVAAGSMCRGALTSLRNICTLSGAESSVREQDLSPRPKLELGRLRSGQKLIYRPLRTVIVIIGGGGKVIVVGGKVIVTPSKVTVVGGKVTVVGGMVTVVGGFVIVSVVVIALKMGC
jgi:hypothetical protein